MTSLRGPGLALAGLLLVAAVAAEPFAWDLPPGLPEPTVPADNPTTAAKVELGRHLFHDPRLSGNSQQACASCHQQELAFTDGRARALGATGALHPRSAMTLTNVAYQRTLTWASRDLTELEDQALVPLLNRTPVEMGVAGREGEVLARLQAEPRYQTLFPRAFPGEQDPVTFTNVARALASFQRTLLSGRSAYDRLLFEDDLEALSDAAWRGMELFHSQRTGCSSCHRGLNLAGAQVWLDQRLPEPVRFHDTGLGRPGDRGLGTETGLAEDEGRFRAPTLRNVAVTAPYMHDGNLPDLEAVLRFYAAGGGGSADGSRRTDLRPFTLSPGEARDLLAFLRSLTDEQFLSDPRFSSPW